MNVIIKILVRTVQEIPIDGTKEQYFDIIRDEHHNNNKTKLNVAKTPHILSSSRNK